MKKAAAKYKGILKAWKNKTILALLFASALLAKAGTQQNELLRFKGNDPESFAVAAAPREQRAVGQKDQAWCDELRMTLNIWFDTKFEKGCGGDNRAKIANAAWANLDSQDRDQMNPESLAAHSLGKEDFMKKATAKDKVVHKAWKNKITEANKKRKASELAAGARDRTTAVM